LLPASLLREAPAERAGKQGTMSVVSGSEVAKYCDGVAKINPNGVDLAPIKVTAIPMQMTIYLHGDKRGYVDSDAEDGEVTLKKEEVLPDEGGFYLFERGGMYELRFPEVRVPASCTGFAFPRSTINRLGIVKLETAVFDSGYSGQPTQAMFTPVRAKIHKDEALVQLVFLRNEKPSELLYSGRYQNEKAT
jgi:deoxycytidine triphosphate deaminase